MDLGEIRGMKTNVKKKAKKQIDELIDRLKKNDFLNNPKIQNLIERVQTAQTALESHGNEESAEGTKAAQIGNVSQQLLDLIKTSDVATRIATKVLSKAETLTTKLQMSGAKKKKSKKKTATKKTTKKKTTKKK